MSFQEDVRSALRAIPRTHRRLSPRSCRVTDAVERPWGERYRVVEWLAHGKQNRYRCIVSADHSVAQVVATLLSFEPGRCYELSGDEAGDTSRRRAPRRDSAVR